MAPARATNWALDASCPRFGSKSSGAPASTDRTCEGVICAAVRAAGQVTGAEAGGADGTMQPANTIDATSSRAQVRTIFRQERLPDERSTATNYPHGSQPSPV